MFRKTGSDSYVQAIKKLIIGELGRAAGGAILAITGIFSGAVTTPALACEETLVVAYQGSDAGKLTIAVNDVVLLRDNPGSFANFVVPSLLLEGENTLRVRLVADEAAADTEGQPSAKAEVFNACQGTFPEAPGQNPDVIGEISLDKAGEMVIPFRVSGLPAYGYLSAEPSDDAGLLEAIARLRKVASDGDIAEYMTYLTPLNGK